VILPGLGRITSTFGFELYDPALGRPPADCPLILNVSGFTLGPLTIDRALPYYTAQHLLPV
jgi:hypothetical protein